MKQIPFTLRMVQGAIGKRLVIKHYKGGRIVVTKYPAMQGIIASDKQRVRRRLFKKAVHYAQKVYADPALKEEKRRILRRPRRLFQALMKEWFRKRREQEMMSTKRIERWRRNVRVMNQYVEASILPAQNTLHTIVNAPGNWLTGKRTPNST